MLKRHLCVGGEKYGSRHFAKALLEHFAELL